MPFRSRFCLCAFSSASGESGLRGRHYAGGFPGARYFGGSAADYVI
ncbi:hypothetical protein [Paenibacillus larvae]|nr:hypothetical protein [Paenibacillus larvae]MCY9745472.1 hypothetical protein [Paenibacillus larvae]MCY9750704.1 hypothetical protein [Paenibacillus larvae]MCY9772207.1 hypothetical protein [Paenibacillus larvae]